MTTTHCKKDPLNNSQLLVNNLKDYSMSPISNSDTLNSKSPSDMRVLIVEDDEFQRNMLVRLLKLNRVETIEQAADGVLALEIIERCPEGFDLIISDLEMPNMDGMEFIRILCERKTLCSLAITSAWNETFLSSIQTMCSAYGIDPLGVLKKPITSKNIEVLLKKIDSKKRGREHVFKASVPRFSIEEILEGVAANQFEPAYQAKMDLQTGRIVGAEALARWEHPVHGTVPPFSFIETLENAGKINELTFSMIAQAAAACRSWDEMGLNIDVAVNLSLTSLTDTKLARHIYDLVRESGLSPERMTLEMTETAAMTELAPVLENLARLRMLGFGLSIDDFGTGFASMQQLSRVAFTELKIDRSFVSVMGEKREAKAIVETSIDIASRLGIKSIAEGVETAEELQILKQSGCNLAQGYYISKPIGLSEFTEFCLQKRANHE